LWDVSDRTDPVRVSTLDGHRGRVTVALSADGHTLAVVGEREATTTLWSVSNPARPVRRAVVNGGTAAVTGLAVSPDGRTLATANGDGTVPLWDVSAPDRPARVATLAGHTGVVHDVAFSPDGRSVATAGADHTAVVWDVTDHARPARTATLAGHPGAVHTVVFNPDGRAVATGGGGGSAVLWDVSDTGRAVRTATLGRISAEPAGSEVHGLAFSHDGRTLATVGMSRKSPVTLWDVTDRGRPTRVGTVQDYVETAAFSPDGRTLAVGRTIDDSVALRHMPRAGSAWDVRRRVHPLPALSGSQVAFAVGFGAFGTALIALALLGRLRRHDLTTRVTNGLTGVSVLGVTLVTIFVLDAATIRPSLPALVVFLLVFLARMVFERTRSR